MYTGNTFFVYLVYLRVTVYPCVYREHTYIVIHRSTVYGLSLCIQGTLAGRGHRNIKCRFIPVYTGNTFLVEIMDVLSPVYPCVYREHSPLTCYLPNQYGLSLCIQGTLPTFTDISAN